MRLGEAAAVRALWRRQRELEGVLEDRLQIEPVKAEALRELEEITERLRKSPWLSHQGAERCVEAVGEAIMALFRHLVLAVDAEGKPQPVLHALARHLYEHVLLPAGRCGGARVAPYLSGCFTYEPPAGVVWDGGPKCQVPSVKCHVPGVTCQVQGPKGEGMRIADCVLRSSARGLRYSGASHSLPPHSTPLPGSHSAFGGLVCGWLAVALLMSGCAGTRPLRGGKAVTTRNPAGVVQQTLVQSENPSQASKQAQASVKTRSYTVPAGSRIVSEGTGGECQV